MWRLWEMHAGRMAFSMIRMDTNEYNAIPYIYHHVTAYTLNAPCFFRVLPIKGTRHGPKAINDTLHA